MSPSRRSPAASGRGSASPKPSPCWPRSSPRDRDRRVVVGGQSSIVGESSRADRVRRSALLRARVFFFARSGQGAGRDGAADDHHRAHVARAAAVRHDRPDCPADHLHQHLAGAVGGKFWMILRRQWPLIVPLGDRALLTMWTVGRKAPDWAFLVLAIVLVVYSALGLLRIRLQIHADLEKPLAPVIGVISGFVAGLVGVPVIPLMPYLQGLDIKPTELVQTLGVVLCATSADAHGLAAEVRPARRPACDRLGDRRRAGDRRHVGRHPGPAQAVDRAVPARRAVGAAADRPLHFRQPPGVISSAPC